MATEKLIMPRSLRKELSLICRDYYQLTKPKVVALLVLTAWVGMMLATPEPPAFSQLFFASAGIALVSAAAAAFNQILDQKIDAQMARTYMRSVYALASRGKCSHPDGLFYGGSGPVWSNFTWRRILSGVVAGRNAILHLNLHSGLGRFGYGELMFVGTAKTPGFNALGACLSEPLLPIFDDAAVAPPVDGPLMRALQEGAGGAHLIPFVLEFGTLCLPAVLRAMRIDAWLNGAGRPANSTVQSLRAEVRAAFCVDDDRWRSMVIDQTVRHGRELILAIEAGHSFS